MTFSKIKICFFANINYHQIINFYNNYVFAIKMYNLRKTKKVLYKKFFGGNPLPQRNDQVIIIQSSQDQNSDIQKFGIQQPQQSAHMSERSHLGSDISMDQESIVGPSYTSVMDHESVPTPSDSSSMNSYPLCLWDVIYISSPASLLSFYANVSTLMTHNRICQGFDLKSAHILVKFMLQVKFVEPMNPFFVLDTFKTNKRPMVLYDVFMSYYSGPQIMIEKRHLMEILSRAFIFKFCDPNKLEKELQSIDESISIDYAAEKIRARFTYARLAQCLAYPRLLELLKFLKHPHALLLEEEIPNKVASELELECGNLIQLGQEYTYQMEIVHQW